MSDMCQKSTEVFFLEMFNTTLHNFFYQIETTLLSSSSHSQIVFSDTLLSITKVIDMSNIIKLGH